MILNRTHDLEVTDAFKIQKLFNRILYKNEVINLIAFLTHITKKLEENLNLNKVCILKINLFSIVHFLFEMQMWISRMFILPENFAFSDVGMIFDLFDRLFSAPVSFMEQ